MGLKCLGMQTVADVSFEEDEGGVSPWEAGGPGRPNQHFLLQLGDETVRFQELQVPFCSG